MAAPADGAAASLLLQSSNLRARPACLPLPEVLLEAEVAVDQLALIKMPVAGADREPTALLVVPSLCGSAKTRTGSMHRSAVLREVQAAVAAAVQASRTSTTLPHPVVEVLVPALVAVVAAELKMQMPASKAAMHQQLAAAAPVGKRTVAEEVALATVAQAEKQTKVANLLALTATKARTRTVCKEATVGWEPTVVAGTIILVAVAVAAVPVALVTLDLSNSFRRRNA